MSKIVLTNIYLVNWYGFINTKIPAGANLTLITGENECGKSTILDAVKYAFIGDFEFNKSSSAHNIGGSKRTLPSYTRCLIDASARTYARPAEKMPNVYSHISLEYYDGVNNNYFVLGTVLETNASDNVSSYWYAMDDTRMDEVCYTYEDKGAVKPYDYQKFQKQHSVQVMSRKDALIKFMQMTGLKLAYREITKFQRKLRSIMTYNPAAKIQEFIKESVLESHDINFDKLRDAKQNIEKINGTLEGIKEEVAALDGILADFAEHEKATSRLAVDDAKIIYKELQKTRAAIESNQATIAKNEVELKHLEIAITETREKKRHTEDSCLQARGDRDQLDCSMAIEEEKRKQLQYEQRQGLLQKQRQELSRFQEQVKQMLQSLDSENSPILQELEQDSYSAIEKETAVNSFKSVVSAQKDCFVEERANIRNMLHAVQKDINHFNEIIEGYNKNKPDYSSVKEQQAFLSEVNREFRKNNIPSEARLACEYVVGLEEEAWREAIEAFLGIHRYSIIVSPEYFEIANRILDRTSHKYIELVNTKRLASKTLQCFDDAVSNKLIIKNETAKKYFAYWLGRIHAVDIEHVPSYENAMSKEGKLSRNMAVTYLNTKKIKTFCLGQEAIELNKQRLQKQIKELEKEEKRLFTEQESKNRAMSQINLHLEAFKEYNYSACFDDDANQKAINESKEHLSRLMDAQKNNTEYMTLNGRVQELEAALADIQKKMEQSQARSNRLSLENDQRRSELFNYDKVLQKANERLDNQKLLHASEVKTAIKEYDEYRSGRTKDGNILLHNSRERLDRRKRELEGLIIGGQKDYNRRKGEDDRLPEGLGQEGGFLARKNKIWVDDLQEINAKMTAQTVKYERIFKNEFVLSLYQTALSAKEDIAGINKELRKLQFATKYQFDVNLLNDKSDYAKILRYAEYLKKTNNVDDGQMVFGKLYGYEDDEIEVREREIKEIINGISNKNDLGVIKAFADYRNYMSYEIIINNEDVKDGKLSKQAGYNSGAGTQIPYTLILSAALSMLYNARVNSTRLIFIDEPFEKMSDHNIKLMLEFFKNQNFQVIFCAPPNKTDSIGYECNTIIPVIKIKNDNMQIGSVQFYDER